MPKSIALAVALIALSFTANAADDLAADVASARAGKGEIFLVDVRHPDEWKQSGVARSAHEISMHKPNFLQRLSALTKGEKDAQVALICATGARTTWLSAELEKRGYTNILNVREGMMGSESGPGWLRRGLPLK